MSTNEGSTESQITKEELAIRANAIITKLKEQLSTAQEDAIAEAVKSALLSAKIDQLEESLEEKANGEEEQLTE